MGFLQKVVDDAKAASDAAGKTSNDLPDSVHYRLGSVGLGTWAGIVTVLIDALTLRVLFLTCPMFCQEGQKHKM